MAERGVRAVATKKDAQVDKSETQDMSAVEKDVKNIEVVTMTDGRKVEFVGKKKLIKESFPENLTVRLDFRNGETRLFVIPSQLTNKFAVHGAEQKLGDATAGTEDIDDMLLDVDALIERLNNGEWGIKREGSSNAGTSILIKALMEWGGKTAEEVKAFLQDKTQADKMALRNNNTRKNHHGHTIKSIVTRLEEEKAAKGIKVDTDALLAAF
jgi:hypothetical protein